VKEEDDRLIKVVSRVATQLGFALRHKQIEESLRHQEALLRRSRDELEISVSQRTVQLTIANEALQAEIFERKRLQEAMLSRVRQQECVVYIGERALSGIELPWLLREACERVAQTLAYVTEIYGWDEKALYLGTQQATLFHTNFADTPRKGAPAKTDKRLTLEDFF